MPIKEEFLNTKTSIYLRKEYTGLKHLSKTNNIVIKPADKDGTDFVWRKDLYIKEAETQLSDAIMRPIRATLQIYSLNC